MKGIVITTKDEMRVQEFSDESDGEIKLEQEVE